MAFSHTANRLAEMQRCG
ncbi:carbohydrate kinase, partial [Escherichia coli]|nr:carbohydrate kinase [Escherichia coli]